MSSGPYRLQRGGFIDRSQRIDFSFDGRALSGFEGDSLASALLANGVRTVARSFKFHRPRGVYAAGIEEPNALVQLHEGVHAIPSVRAPVIQLQPGLSARSQAGWPSVSFDLLRTLDFAATLFAAGFYNKTFMWPSWHFYEPAMRELAEFLQLAGVDVDRCSHACGLILCSHDAARADSSSTSSVVRCPSSSSIRPATHTWLT